MEVFIEASRKCFVSWFLSSWRELSSHDQDDIRYDRTRSLLKFSVTLEGIPGALSHIVPDYSLHNLTHDSYVLDLH